MKQKSYQKVGTVATVVAVAVSVIGAVLKLCGLLAFSWWWVMTPFIVVVVGWLLAMAVLFWALWYVAKHS